MGQPTLLYCNYSTTATVTMSLAGNGETSDVLIATEDTYYAPLATTSFSVTIDLGAAQTIDTYAMLGANLNGASIEVRASTDNFSASDVSIKASGAIVSDVNASYETLTSSTYQYWKFLFTGHASNIRIANICMMERAVFPYFETDPDIRNFTPTVTQLVSQAGIYIGSNQQKSMRQLDMEWGQVTPTELVVIQAFAEACIKVVNPFYLVPDIEETDVFFGWLPNGGTFASPQTSGIHDISALTMETRAV